MGVEFIGLNPSDEVGKSFGSSWFRMNPLLILVEDLMRHDPIMINTEHGMDADAARAYGERLDAHLDAGGYEAYMTAGKHELLTKQYLEEQRIFWEKNQKEIDAELPRWYVFISKIWLRIRFGRGQPVKQSSHIWDEMPEAPSKDRVRWLAAFLRTCGGYKVSW